MDDMDISRLTVLHRPKDAAGHGLAPAHEALLRNQGLYLDTCLRQLVIVDSTVQTPSLRINDPQVQQYCGRAAYSFLLQTATGLNSSIPGETNIFGQFLHAWRNWRAHIDCRLPNPLDVTLHRLFGDCRQIRRDYLQGIGGNSYGSLVRKLLAPDASARILFIGTGKLAHSIRPLFDAYEIAFWNHRRNDVAGDGRWQFFAADQQMHAAAWATHVVLTTPAEVQTDATWTELLQRTQAVVHLGRRRAEPGAWIALPAGIRYYDLDDVFELRSRQSTVRSLQLRRARKACEQIASSAITHADPGQSRTANACS